MTVTMSEPVNVTGTPTLKLNDGGTASYVSGSGTSALVFDYTVATGEHSSDLQVNKVVLPSSTSIKDAGGNSANLAGIQNVDLGIEVGGFVIHPIWGPGVAALSPTARTEFENKVVTAIDYYERTFTNK